MISIKAIAALGLTGLGAATMSTDVYLANKAPARPAPLAVVVEAPAPPPEILTPVEAKAPPEAPPLQIEPVVIYGRQLRKITKPPPAEELTVCSDWHSLASGPQGRGVRTLCVPGSTDR